jgi:hypothetical protein
MEYLGFEEEDILGHKRTTTTHYNILRDTLSYFHNIPTTNMVDESQIFLKNLVKGIQLHIK